MANWLTRALTAFVYGPPARDYLPHLAPHAPGRVPERRAILDTTANAALRGGMLIHGPGATEALRRAWEYGGDFNAVASICLFRLMTDFPQAPLVVYRREAHDRRDPLPDHPLTRLLDRPNHAISRTQLLGWTTYALNAHGNAYWRKVRAGDRDTGNVVELWPLSPASCAPVRERGSRNFVDYYLYRWGPGRDEREAIPPHNIVHHKFGLDDRNQMLGISRLRRVIREIATDDEATEFVARLLRNNAVPGLVVLTEQDAAVDAEGAQLVKERIDGAFTGDNRGRTAVVSPAVRDVKQFGFEPRSLDLAPLTGQVEALIAAVLGVPAQVAGLPVGLQHATYSNFEQAHESYTELTLLPQYAASAETIKHQLWPDFSSDPREVVEHDVRGLRALQEDQDALSARIMAQWQGDLLTLDAALAALGYDPVGGAEGALRYSRLAGAGGAGAATPPAPASRAAALERKASPVAEEAFAARLEELRASLLVEYEPIVARYLESQRRRVVSKVEAAG